MLERRAWDCGRNRSAAPDSDLLFTVASRSRSGPICHAARALAQLRAQGINPDAVGKGPKTFSVNQPPPESHEKYHRSAAEDRTHEGEVFDSKLELAAYRWLVDHAIKFERQVEIELQPGFEFEGKKIRKISYFCDFKITTDSGETLWVDMKGMETAEFKLKWKMTLFKGVHVLKVKSLTALVELLVKKSQH